MKPGSGKPLVPGDVDRILRGPISAAPSLSDWGAGSPACNHCGQVYDAKKHGTLAAWGEQHRASCSPTQPYEAAELAARDAAIVEAAAAMPDPPPADPEE